MTETTNRNTLRSVGWTALACLLGFTLIASSPESVDSDARVSVALSAEPDGESDELRVTIPSTATGTSIPVFLKNLLPTTASDLRIYASATKSKDLLLADESAVTIDFAAAEDGLVELGPHDEIAGTLTLTGLTTPGTYTASIFLDHSTNDQQTIATVLITKRAELAFTLESAGENGLEVTERSDRFDRALYLISDSAEDVTIQVTLGQMVGPDGHPTVSRLLVDCELAPTAVSVGPLERVPLEFLIATPLAGDYLGTLEVLAAPDRLIIPIKISRDKSVPSLDVNGPLATPISIGIEELVGIGSAADTHLTFVLNETQGREVSVASPTLFISRDVEGTATGTDVTIREVTAEAQNPQLDPNHLETAPCLATEAEENPEESNNKDASPLVVVPPEGSAAVGVELVGFAEPGEYHGLLRFGVEDATALTVEFDVTARRAAWVAAAVIFLGILIGMVLRLVANTLLPRLKLQSRLARAQHSVSDLLRERELSPLDADLLRDIQSRAREAAETLRSWNWRAAGEEVEAITTQVACFRVSTQIRASYGRLADSTPFSERWAMYLAAMQARTLTEQQEGALEGGPMLLNEIRNAGPAPVAAAAAPPGSTASVTSINRSIQVVTLLAALALMALGTFLGVQVLWVPNQVWGDVPDFFAALLWGAGVWAASGQAFGGTEALLKSILGDSTG